MKVTHQPLSAAETRTNRRIRAAGIAAMVAAALGSVVATSEAAPATDRGCTMSVYTGGGFSDDCAATSSG